METRNIIFNSEHFYSGRGIDEDDCYTIDSYYNLSNNLNIDNETIEFDQDAFESELEYFNSYLDYEKTLYEKRYNTTVLELALVGKVGVWKGDFVGGKIVDFNRTLSMDVESIEVEIEDDRTLTIRGRHHDGTHKMCLYFLTENKMKQLEIYNLYEYEGSNAFGYEVFEKIYNNLNPLKVNKKNRHYNFNKN